MIKPRTWIGAMILPALLGCPGTGGDPAPSPPNPGEKVLAWQYNGSKQAVAGSYGITWQIFASPATGNGRLHLNGPGTLTDLLRNPLDLSSSDLEGQGWYVPPATIPAGGTTVYLSAECRAPYTNAWETSPQYPIKVVQQTTPMEFRLGNGSPTSVTLHAGGTNNNWFVYINPLPLNSQPQFSLTSTQPIGTDLGSASGWNVVDYYNRDFTYTAPSMVATAMDVNIRVTLHDPWLNLDPYVDFTVHLVP